MSKPDFEEIDRRFDSAVPQPKKRFCWRCVLTRFEINPIFWCFYRTSNGQRRTAFGRCTHNHLHKQAL